MPQTFTFFVKAKFVCILLIACTASVVAQQTFRKSIGSSGFEKGSALKLLPGQGFIIGGETESFGLDERDMLLLRTDTNGNVLWSKSYGGAERETVNDVLQLPDGGFMMTAEKYQPHKQEGENLTLLKTDDKGNLVWKKIYDEGGNETEGFSMQQTPEKNYIIAGMVKNMTMISDAFFSMSAEDQGMYLLKVDGNGGKLWSRRFDYGADNVSSTGTSVLVAADGTYMVTGNIAKQGKTDKKIERPAQNVNMADVRNMLLAKVKPNGNLQWAREYSANSITMGYNIIEQKGGGFLVAGNTNVTATNMDIFLTSLGADGSILWSKTYGGQKFESVADVVQTPDGGFVLSGLTQGLGNGSLDALVFKVDAKGNIVWSKCFGTKNEEMPSKLALTPSGIVLLGATAGPKSQSFDVMLVKMDWNGNSACFGTNVTLTSAKLNATMQKADKAKMTEVEQGIMPPNMAKPDVGNVKENKRETKTVNLCD